MADAARAEAPAPKDGAGKPATAGAGASLEAREFSLYYGTHQALKSVSLQIPSHSVMNVLSS